MGANTYAWSPNVSIIDTTLSNPISYNLNDIEYFVTGVDTNGCSNVDSLYLEISKVSADFDYVAFCLGDSGFLYGLIFKYKWNFKFLELEFQ